MPERSSATAADILEIFLLIDAGKTPAEISAELGFTVDLIKHVRRKRRWLEPAVIRTCTRIAWGEP
jgi:hypothetical protein